VLVSYTLLKLRSEIKVNSPSGNFIMQTIDLNLISTDVLTLPLLADKKNSVSVLRLDKIHPLISGNKFFKLRYYLEEAKRLGNHILATAAACCLNGFQSIGYIRGEEAASLSFTLTESKKAGMELIFLSREDYDNKKRNITSENEDSYVIGEGGYGMKGVEGAATILDYCTKEDFTHICCAAGTGTMTAGLLTTALPHQQVISISVLKNNLQLEEDVQSLTGGLKKDVTIFHGYHFGGYAKQKPALIAFMNEFYKQTGISTDFVYTGKLFFAINDLISKNFFPSGSRILAIHSGGLQGNSSLSNGTLIF
jgi:1-aminocyclopropane-1-carboxylate deaminase